MGRRWDRLKQNRADKRVAKDQKKAERKEIKAEKEEIEAERASDEDALKQQEALLRERLEVRLGWAIATPHEPFRKKTARRLTNPVLMVSAGVVGLGIATVLTAGTVHIGLGAAAAAAVAGNDSAVVDWWKSKRRGVVHLDGGAVAFLLELDVVDVQVKTVRSAVPMMERADAYLTEPILREAYTRNAMRAAGPSSLMLPANVGGFALLAAGLLLIAIIVIPEYIRDPVMRAGVVIASIGGILVGIALFNSFKTSSTENQ